MPPDYYTKNKSSTFQPIMHKKNVIHCTELNILTFNDIYELCANSEGLGGLAEMETLIQSEKKKRKNVFATLNGDFLVVTTLAQKYKGEHMVDILNTMSCNETIH
jgi:2',3'-cyclic-nucleotide 2'-phosphodiesterase (5'-nucleotidase family)